MTPERWRELPLDRQILNIASELSRAKKWLFENNDEFFKKSIERSLELIDLTTELVLSPGFLREWLRFREFLAGYYVGQNSKNDFPLLQKNLLDLNESVHNLNLAL